MASKQEPPKLSLAKRRTSTHNLGPLIISQQDGSQQLNSVSASKTSPDIIEEGKVLFENFVAEEIKKESPDNLDVLSTPQGYKNPIWAKTGRDLRLLADEFARTKEREKVRLQAEAVHIHITYDEFKDLLAELFLGEGMTRERIIVLFYFCSDITIRSLHAGIELFNRFMSWCLQFITDRVCLWVQNHGGWSEVLKTPFNSFYRKAFWIVAATTLLIVAFRKWRNS